MRRFLLTTAVLASPLVWFASHSAQFALSPWTCPWRSNIALWLVVFVALLLDAGSGILAWKQQPDVMPRWLSISGAALSAGFFVVIVAQAIPVLMLGGCE